MATLEAFQRQGLAIAIGILVEIEELGRSGRRRRQSSQVLLAIFAGTKTCSLRLALVTAVAAAAGSAGSMFTAGP
jgi:hypothetical protein